MGDTKPLFDTRHSSFNTGIRIAPIQHSSLITRHLEALRLSLEAWPLLARVRWALWREPFPAFHAAWNAQTETERYAASKVLSDECGVLNEGFVAPIQHSSLLIQHSDEPDATARREAWECAHAVSRMARLVPRASCLTQALVLQRLLARRGWESSLFLGVDSNAEHPKSEGGKRKSENHAPPFPRSGFPVPRSGVPRFEAHAWVEWRGRVLIGGDISRWTPLPLVAPRADTARSSAPESR